MLKKLFKKSLIYFVTLVMGKLLTAVFFIILARILQPEKFGVITYFVTVVQLTSVIADFGMKQWYQKKMAENKQPLLLNQFVWWRGIFFVLSVVAILIIQKVTNFLEVKMLLPLMAALLLEGMMSVADGFYLAREKSLNLGYKLIARNLILFLALLFIRAPENYTIFFWAYDAAMVAVLIFYFPWYVFKNDWSQVNKKTTTVKAALPYAAIDDLGTVYSKADSLIIENFLGESALGIYGAAYRYLDGFNLLPQALFHNLFPLAAKEKGISKEQVRKMVAVMTGLGLLVGGFIFVSSDFLTSFLMGESYAAAGEILHYFAVVIVMFFFNAPLNTIIQSSKKVKQYVPCMAGVVALNIVLNFWWTPTIGVMGAVYAMMICEASLIVINLCLVKKLQLSD